MTTAGVLNAAHKARFHLKAAMAAFTMYLEEAR